MWRPLLRRFSFCIPANHLLTKSGYSDFLLSTSFVEYMVYCIFSSNTKNTNTNQLYVIYHKNTNSCVMLSQNKQKPKSVSQNSKENRLFHYEERNMKKRSSVIDKLLHVIAGRVVCCRKCV